ncbi:pyridoxal-phosphate dependent enzyme [Clostridium sp.]|uniref:pyridoxal-phosphate dependent enzyme n=1 Tax=Clostridium sp. TaxID=1506 RepID=UPI003D6CA9AB
MNNALIEKRVGRTPLVRARNLEEKLGVKNIYLKLEGNNPSGYRIDRLTYILIKDALRVNKNTICLSVGANFAKSLAHLSQFYDMNCVFVVMDKNDYKDVELFNKPNIEFVEYAGTSEERVEHVTEICKKNAWYNANPGMNNSMISSIAFSKIADELYAKIKGEVDTVFLQSRYGYSLEGLDLGFRKLWVGNEIKKLPILNSCSKDTDNSVNDTVGKVIELTEDEVKHYVSEFEEIENIKLTVANGYSIAGFMKQVEEKKLPKGNHVILLNDGKIDIDVRRATKEECLDNDEIITLVHDWLNEFTDPICEIEEAYHNAVEKGFIITAVYDGEICGIGIVVNFGFEHFASKYHLAYIATVDHIEGSGIATMILNEAVELSEGNISLHVERNNYGAIKLYEKMGFKDHYSRMIHLTKND